MNKYLVIYHGSIDAEEQMKDATLEDMKNGMEAWMAWAKKCGDGLVDLGSPLGGGQRVSDSGRSASQKSVVGYSILQAEDMEGALALLEDHPHMGWAEGCEIEFHESLPLPG